MEYVYRGGVKFRYPKSTVIDLNRPSLIEFGDNLDINANFTIMTHDFGTYVFRNLYNDFVSSSGRVVIGSNIYFGRDVTILKGVRIGDNCIIGNGSIVTKDIPANSVAVGVPCKRICSIEEYYNKRKGVAVREAIDYGVSIIEHFGRMPRMSDFTEEWTLWLSKDAYAKHPEIHAMVDFRIGHIWDQYWAQHKAVFNSFDEFIGAIKAEYNNRHNN
jgi:acyl-[acyl carrier protein]--UDP-N-acetylglucosamine O-acyltransferase